MKAVLLPTLSGKAKGILAEGEVGDFKVHIVAKVIDADTLMKIASACYAGFVAAVNAIGGDPSKVSQLIVDYNEDENTPERVKGVLI